MGPAGAGRGGFALREIQCGGYAPGGAAACGTAPAQVPEGLPRCLQLKRRSELCFDLVRLIVRSEIAMVGRADLRHVIIVCPLHHRRRRARCLVLAFHVCVLWFSFGAADEKHRRRYAHATDPAAPLIESLNACETQARCGQSPPLLIQE
jgi:hypothetical protein